jgi:hypothetical protein
MCLHAEADRSAAAGSARIPPEGARQHRAPCRPPCPPMPSRLLLCLPACHPVPLPPQLSRPRGRDAPRRCGAPLSSPARRRARRPQQPRRGAARSARRGPGTDGSRLLRRRTRTRTALASLAPHEPCPCPCTSVPTRPPRRHTGRRGAPAAARQPRGPRPPRPPALAPLPRRFRRAHGTSAEHYG